MLVSLKTISESKAFIVNFIGKYNPKDAGEGLKEE